MLNGNEQKQEPQPGQIDANPGLVIRNLVERIAGLIQENAVLAAIVQDRSQEVEIFKNRIFEMDHQLKILRQNAADQAKAESSIPVEAER